MLNGCCDGPAKAAVKEKAPLKDVMAAMLEKASRVRGKSCAIRDNIIGMPPEKNTDADGRTIDCLEAAVYQTIRLLEDTENVLDRLLTAL